MKQAILITSYKDFVQLKNLISAFDETFNIYVHIDKKSNVSPKALQELKTIENVKYLYQDYKVNWGGLNHLKAYLKLSTIALKDKENSFFHLITGQDYPIKTADYFKAIVAEKKGDYLEYFKMPSDCWYKGGMNRLEYYNFYDIFNAKKSFKWINRMIHFQKKIRFKRSINDYLGQLYGGSTYWSLSREVLHYVIDFTEKNPKFFKRFKHTFCAEEIYFQTVIMNSSYSNRIINDNLRFIDWKSGRGGYPAFLDENDFQEIINSDKLFARKIDENKSDLLQMLTTYKNNSL
tara:strand:+ start:820 stop:1692 length:873 start_codon:yes stop_codon:yes gene_type:complete